MRNLYRALAGGFGVIAVAAQYWLLMHNRTGAALFVASVHFFSFFTILTNILAAAALLVPLVAPRSGPGRFLARPSVRTAIAGYVIMVGVVYYLLLRNLSQVTGATLFFERALHYVTLPLFVVDWLLFVQKARLDWRIGFLALGFPLVYVGWTLAQGALTGWYPYPFVDVPELGYPRALLNIAGLVAAFLALELLLVGIGRGIDRRKAAGTKRAA